MNRGWLRGLVRVSFLSVILAALIPATGLNAVMALEVGEWHFNPATKHYYAVIDGLTWAEAEAHAVRLGGHLVTINDRAEQDWLAATFTEQGLYIGLTDRASEGSWVWASGEPVTYTDWVSDEPNNCIDCIPSSPKGEDVATMRDPRGSGWNDVTDFNVGPALIEVRALPTTGWISGAVTAAGSPVPDIGVEALALDPDTTRWVSAGSATTDAAGAYEIGSLPAADYRIAFRGGATFADQYWPGRSYPHAATTVHLTAGGVVAGVDGALVFAGKITGRVTAGVDPVADIAVKADAWWPGAPLAAAMARTAPDGSYALVGLAPGRYRISFEGTGGGFLPEVYDDASLASPTLVDVAAGATTGGIDAVLELPGSPGDEPPGPAASEPYIVLGTGGRIVGQGWPGGASVALTLDDPATPRSPDLDLSAVADADGAFTLEIDSDVAAGLVATAADGTYLKTHTVTEVRITAVDAAKDTVWGTAAPGSTIAITVRTGGAVEPEREATAGVAGTWVVDFSVPAGPQPGDAAHDLVAGESVSAQQSDDDGDMTQDDLVVPSPEAGAPAVGFREPGPLVPTLTTYIPTPADVSTDPRVVGANLALAALVMILFTIAGELLNRTLAENEEFLARAIRPARSLRRLRDRTDAALRGRMGAGRRLTVARLAGIAALYGLIFSLLDQTWDPLSPTGLWLFLSMAIAFGVIGIADDVACWARARRWGMAPDLDLRTGNLLLALTSTAACRLVVLIPGIMIGTPEALEVEHDRLDERRRSQLAATGLGTLAAIGGGAWLLTAGTAAVRSATRDGELPVLVGGLEAFLLVVFAVAVQNTFAQFLAFRGSPGRVLEERHRVAWFVGLLGVTFLFWHTLVNPRGDLAAALEATNVRAFLATALGFTAAALATWAILRLARRHGARGEHTAGAA